MYDPGASITLNYTHVIDNDGEVTWSDMPNNAWIAAGETMHFLQKRQRDVREMIVARATVRLDHLRQSFSPLAMEEDSLLSPTPGPHSHSIRDFHHRQLWLKVGRGVD